MSAFLERIAGPSTASLTKSMVLAANAYLGRYREVVWLIGDGRSGTTWVSSVINHRRRYREMFEPFHPRVMKLPETLQPNTYIRPNDPRESFRKAAADVFSGRLTDSRVDRETAPGLYSGLLVKDIFANLFAFWARQRFPHLKILLLVRHPFAVALSKLRKRRWLWTTDPLDLLDQPDLRDDFLRPFEPLIRAVSNRNDYVQNQVLIWSILNWVPLMQFRPEDLHVVFYEDVLTDPEHEVTRIRRHLRPDRASGREAIPAHVIRKPSRVTAADSPLRTGASPVESWKDELPAAQIDAGLEILGHFGLDALYTPDSVPNHAGLAALRQGAVTRVRG